MGIMKMVPALLGCSKNYMDITSKVPGTLYILHAS